MVQVISTAFIISGLLPTLTRPMAYRRSSSGRGGGHSARGARCKRPAQCQTPAARRPGAGRTSLRPRVIGGRRRPEAPRVLVCGDTAGTAIKMSDLRNAESHRLPGTEKQR
jgi:hypothetical protein